MVNLRTNRIYQKSPLIFRSRSIFLFGIFLFPTLFRSSVNTILFFSLYLVISVNLQRAQPNALRAKTTPFAAASQEPGNH